MASYYISASRGSDSTGTGTASNPWKTIGKAVGTSPAITLSGTGDVVWVEPGPPYREVVTLALSPTLSGPLSIIGDCDGAGFLAGGYSTPATGVVEWRGWSDDVTQINTGETLIASGKSYVTIQGFKMIGAQGTNPGVFNVSGTWSDWTIQDCIFVGSIAKPIIAWFAGAAGAALNLTIKRCDFISVNNGSYGMDIRMPNHTAEYGINVLVQNCRFIGVNTCIRLAQVGGSGTFFATGVAVQNCTFLCCGTCVAISYGAGVALTTPSTVYGCNMMLCTTGVTGGQTTHLTENGNTIYCSTPRTGVSIGANSITSACPAFDLNDGRLAGLPLRPFGEPSLVSATTATGNYGTTPTVDLSNRPRPEGYGLATAAFGALERHDTATVQSSVFQAGTAAEQIVGPGSQEYVVPVGASATTLAIYTQADTNYGTSTPPVFSMDAEPSLGVSSASVTATANTGTWNQLTLGPFTPTSAGYVKVRVKAVPAAASGICYIDTFSGSTGDPSAMNLSYRGIVPKFLSSATVNTTIQIFNSEC